MAELRSDALVVFGVTGDLAHKQIFPALFAMEKRGTLKTPVIGVAFPKWSLERLLQAGWPTARNGRNDKADQARLDGLLARN